MSYDEKTNLENCGFAGILQNFDFQPLANKISLFLQVQNLSTLTDVFVFSTNTDGSQWLNIACVGQILPPALIAELQVYKIYVYLTSHYIHKKKEKEKKKDEKKKKRHGQWGYII